MKIVENIIWRWRNTKDRVNLMSRKLRTLILFVVLLLLYFIFHGILFSHSESKRLSVERDKKNTQIQLRLLNVKKTELQFNIRKLNENKAKHERLKKQLAQLTEKINLFSESVVSSEKTAEVLKAMLTDVGLSLNALQSLPSQPLQQLEGITQALSQKGIELSFSGGYFATLNYLKKLEALNWQFFWNGLDYQVVRYPNARVLLKLYILSI